jgi:hypothetical protein
MCPNEDILYTSITEKLFNKKTDEEKGEVSRPINSQKRICKQRENSKKQNAPSVQSLKKTLANSGYSENIADKIWKYYNLQEL